MSVTRPYGTLAPLHAFGQRTRARKSALARIPRTRSAMLQVNPGIKLANFITLKARPGKEAALAEFLSGGASAVASTEPQTQSWFAVRINPSTFAIIDFFADKAGQDAHVGGQVAAALKSRAGDLVEGGWDGGVLKNFQV